MNSLPQLRASLLAAAERHAGQTQTQTHTQTESSAADGPRRLSRLSLRRRGPLAVMLLVGLLTLAAVAYATTQLIQTGAPVRSEEGFTPNAGAGVAIPTTEGLLGIAAGDPSGGPPWTMRVYDTSRGLGCVQVGRLDEGRIGVLGEDGAFNDDGLFHPLPSQASQAEGRCVLLDGHGHAFLGVANYRVPASGLPRQCPRLGSEQAGERCARADPRDIFYGLLGPEARSITYTLEGRTHTVPTVGPEGAYLIVERTPPNVMALGVGGGVAGVLPAGGGTLSSRTGHVRLPQPIKQITYTHGRTCMLGFTHNRGSRGGNCTPPVGYVTEPIHVPSSAEMASPIETRLLPAEPIPGRRGSRQVGLLVSFTAHASVSSAASGYSANILPAHSGRCKAGNVGGAAGELGRNVRRGETVHLLLTSGEGNARSMFPDCPGLAHGEVLYTIPSLEASSSPSFGPFAHRSSAVVLVGRFTYDAFR